MTESAEAGADKEPRHFGWLGWAVLLAAVVLIGLAAFRLAAGKRLAGQVKAMQGLGLPTTPAELDAWYPEASIPERNAASGILQAMADIEASDAYLDSRESRESEDFWESWGGTTALPESQRQLLMTTMAGLKNHMAELRGAAALPESRYDVDLSAGIATLLPHVQHVRDAARVLRYDAMAATIEGDTERALASTLAIFDVGHSLENEPLIISGLVRIACDVIGLQTLQLVVLRHDLSALQRRRIAEKLTTSLAAKPSALGYAGEMACITDTMRQLPSYMGVTSLSGSSSRSPAEVVTYVLHRAVWMIGLGDLDTAYALTRTLPFYSAASETDPAVRLAKMAKTSSARPPIYFIGSRMLLPAMDQFLEKELQWRALLLAARQAVMPAEGAPFDPFTATPMVSKTVDGYRRIYSFGSNGKYDGVESPPAKMSKLTDDLYFMVPLSDDAPKDPEGLE